MTAQEIEILVNAKHPWPKDRKLTGAEAGELAVTRGDYRHFLLNADKQAAEYRSTENEQPLPNPAIASGLSELITPKQLGMIRALGREKRVDIEKECGKLFGCPTHDLSKKGASGLINHLLGFQSRVREANAFAEVAI